MRNVDFDIMLFTYSLVKHMHFIIVLRIDNLDAMI